MANGDIPIIIVAALRQAQLALLHGKTDVTTNTPRSVVAGSEDNKNPASAFTPDPKARFAHPYFWAPFILIGNWR